MRSVRQGGRPGRILCFSSGSLSSRIVLWYSVPVRASVLTSVCSGGRAGGSLLRSAGYLSGSSFVRCCRRQVTAGGASSSLRHGCGVWRRCRHNLLPSIAASGLQVREGLAGRHPLPRNSLRWCSRSLQAWRFPCRSCARGSRNLPCCPFVGVGG